MLLLSLVLEWVYALNVTTCKIIVIIICLTMGVHAECDRSQHSGCHYVLFYSEYIILLNVAGHTIHGVIITSFFLFLPDENLIYRDENLMHVISCQRG